ncbi:MAG: hypothetical protein JWQ48_627 [Conexibacter sp.]|nr:hypothetical protein [Conexibacter sp.]
MIRAYTRLYADAAGVTHLEDVELEGETRGVSESDLVAAFSDPLEVETLQFRDVVREADATMPHNAPRRMFIVQLRGRYAIETSDGARREIGPGGVLLVEDVDGDGHITRRVGDEPRLTLVVTLREPRAR